MAKLLRGLQIAAITLLACLLVQVFGAGGPMSLLLWPASALALAFGWRHGSIWAIPAALASGLWAYTYTTNLLLALGAIVASATGPMLTIDLLHRLGRWKPADFRIDALLRFVLITTLFCAPIDALIATLTLSVASPVDADAFAPRFAAWWLLDTLGMLLIVPSVLTVSRRAIPAPRGRVPPALHLPTLALTAAISIAVASLSWRGQAHLAEVTMLLYLPVLGLAALHLAERTLSLSLLIASLFLLVIGPSQANDTLSLESAVLILVTALGALTLQAVSADRREALTQIAEQARHDTTTGLLNDRGLLAELGERLARGPREHHGLLGIHIANFDIIHDLCGPIQALALEQRLAALLSRQASGLQAARLSSGRFALILSCEAVPQLRAVARELYTSLNAQTIKAAHTNLRLQASVGGLLIDRRIATTAEDVLLSLSDAMAIAASARDPRLFVEPLSQPMIDARRSHQSKIEFIREAIRNQYLEVHAQPILDPLAPEGMRSYEVLTRLRDSDGSLIRPPEFLPLTVQAQMIVELDRAVITKVFGWLATNPNALAVTHKCSINLSGQTMGDAAISEFIRAQRALFAIPANKIVFEITESEAIRHPRAASRLVDDLKADGFGIALDDFGTGLATFEYLKRFALDYLKIDGSFIRNLVDDPVDQEIVLSTVRIAQRLQLQIVAEHVHSLGVFTLLRDLGVEHVQGELIGSAVPIEHLFRLPPPRAPSTP